MTAERPRESSDRPVSPRELEVLRLVAQGLSGREVAERLYRSQRTVESHIRSVYRKLGAHNRVEMMHAAARLGLLDETRPPEPRPEEELEIKGRALEVLKAIDDRLAEVPHDRYFDELALALCGTLSVRWAGVTEASPGSDQLDIIAIAADGVLDERTICGRHASPCGSTLSQGEVVVLDGMAERFPTWPFVAHLPIRSYIGVRLDDRLLGTVGSLWIMDDKPMQERDLLDTILRMIARRTAAELALAKTLHALGDEAPTEFDEDDHECEE